MDGLMDWIFPSTRIGDVIRFRPRALETLYRGKMNPWICLGMTLEELSRREGFSLPELLKELSDLRVPAADSNWEQLPACYLIDYLTEEHRTVMHSDLPAIRTALDLAYQGSARDQELLRMVTHSFHAFAEVLMPHLQEEENVIFPAILQNEYLLGHPGKELSPQPASERLSRTSSISGHEAEFEIALRYWLETTRSSRTAIGQPEISEPAFRLISSLGARLEAHAKMEQRVLLAMAERIEKELRASPPHGG